MYGQSYLMERMSERMNESVNTGEFVEENIHLYLKRLDGRREGSICNHEIQYSTVYE